MAPNSDQHDDELRATDALKKDQQKQYAEAKRKIAVSAIEAGSKVLVKQMAVKKADPRFAEESTVVQRQGNMVTAETLDGKAITRNESHFVQIPETDKQAEAAPGWTATAEAATERTATAEAAPGWRRSNRSGKPPDRLVYS